MDIWKAILLGFIQGVTEFLPISSSGHLELGHYLLGLSYQGDVFFDLICHLGTLLAIVWMFFPQIKEGLTTDRTSFLQVIIGTLPLFPLVFLLKPLKALFHEPQYLGAFFLLTATFLFAGVYLTPLSSKPAKRRWFDPLVIGLFQALAVLPGVSRSGSTVSAARMLGWKQEQALQFSFLLAIPAILGATVLEGWQMITHRVVIEEYPSLGALLAGFVTSFVVGSIALWVLMRLLTQDKWIYFAWYCLLLGFFTMIYFN